MKMIVLVIITIIFKALWHSQEKLAQSENIEQTLLSLSLVRYG